MSLYLYISLYKYFIFVYINVHKNAWVQKQEIIKYTCMYKYLN